MARNEKVSEILRETSKERLVPVGNSLLHHREVDYDEFAQQIVGATVLAILSTDCANLTKTTYDKDFVSAVISQVTDSVRDYWRF